MDKTASSKYLLAWRLTSYAKKIWPTLSTQLARDYGQRFGLRVIGKFFGEFPDENIVATPSRQLIWCYFLELLLLDKPLQQDFQTEVYNTARWRASFS